MRKVWKGLGVGLLTAGLGAGAVAALQAATGIVGHWELDNPTPTDDLSPNANDGTMTGAPGVGTDVPTPIAGFSTDSLRVGPGLQYMQATNNAPLDAIQNQSYTLSAWFKPASAPPNTAPNDKYAILMKEGYNEGLYFQNIDAMNTTQGIFAMEHWTTNNDGVGGGDEIWPSTAGTWTGYWNVNAWYHVAGVVDATAQTTTLVVTPMGSTTPTTVTQAWASVPPVVANSWAGHAALPWRVGVALPGDAAIQWQADGTIDDVRIYSRALTAGEIAAIAAGTDLGLATLTPAPPPPAPAVPGSNKEGEEGCSCSSIGPPARPVLWSAIAFAVLGLFLLRRR